MTGHDVKQPPIEIRDALEAALNAAKTRRELKEEVEQEAEMPLDQRTNGLKDQCTDASVKVRDAHRDLAARITEALGEPPWTALLAGHLIFADGYGLPVIIPIENVHRLDNLRRFP